MSDEKTVILKVDLDTSGLKKQANLASVEVQKIKALQSAMLANKTKDEQASIKSSVAYMKLNEQLRINTKSLKDSTSALAINENLANKSVLTTNEQRQAQKALAVAYNNLTQEQKDNTEEGRAITAQYKAMNDAINQTSLNVNDGRMNVGLYENSLSSLKQELKAMQNIMAGTNANSEEYIKASEKAGELKDKLKEVKENTSNLAGGSGFEKMSNTLGGLKEDLLNLDFEGVSEKAKALQQVSSKMTFKEVIGGVKSMGSAFFSLGRALLANPLFLLVAVIGAVVGALVYFSSEEETAEEETDKFNRTLAHQNAMFDRNTESIRQNAKHRLDLAKAQGKSTKEIQQIELANFDEEERIRRNTLAKNKAVLMEKKRLYMLSLKEGNDENAKKLHEEIVQDKEAIAQLKLGRQKYYQDKKVMLINNANELKKEQEAQTAKELEQQKAIEEKSKANYEAYKQRKQAEQQLAKEIANNITQLTISADEAELTNKENSLNASFQYRKKVAELTIKDATELNTFLIDLEKERQTEITKINDESRKLEISKIQTDAKNQISELKGSKEKIAEQTILINENTAQKIEAVNIDYAKKQQDLETINAESLKKIEEQKAVDLKEIDAKRLVDLEAQIQEALNANISATEKEIELAKEKNRQIQADDTKSAEEKKLATAKMEAEILAINKTASDKQIELDKKTTEEKKSNQQALIDASQQLVTDLFSIQQQNIQKDLEDTTNANNEKQNALQKQFDNGLISSQDYEAKKLALENQSREEERKIKKKQFEAGKKASIIEATIATAIAVAKALPNPLLSILAGVSGASQIALIANQPTPAFAMGGKVLSGQRIGQGDGRSIRRSNGDNLLATVRTGEVILNERQQNALGGARTFKRLGVPGFANGGLAGQSISNSIDSQMNSQNEILDIIRNIPNPVVAVTDINTGQGNYAKVIESSTIS